MRPFGSGMPVRGLGASAWRALVALAAAGVFLYVVFVLPQRMGYAPADLAAGPVSTATAPATAPVATSTAPAWKPPRFTARQNDRNAMVRTIRAYGLIDEPVLKVMAAVPRHEFVRKQDLRAAYADRPLRIGHAQTISQPYIVAYMTHLLKLTPKSRVLEIGTGSAYQAAVLAHFTPHVYSIEIIKPLADEAGGRLKRLGYGVVEVRHGDGYYGWAEKGPFDAVIVTCAAAAVPPPLLRQLKPGGRMVVPVGGRYAVQSLMLVQKQADGTVRSRSLMPVRFVPMLRARETKE